MVLKRCLYQDVYLCLKDRHVCETAQFVQQKGGAKLAKLHWSKAASMETVWNLGLTCTQKGPKWAWPNMLKFHQVAQHGNKAGDAPNIPMLISKSAVCGCQLLMRFVSA